MRTHGKAVCLASLLLSSAALADITVKEEIEPGPVGVGDPIQVRVAVEGAEGPVQARLPSGDFQLLGTSRSSSIQMRSGPAGMETSRNEQITFTLVGTKPGPLTIPAAQVVADGENLTGQPGHVEVQAGHVSRQSSRQDDDEDADPFASMQRQMRRFGLNDPFMQHLLSGDPFADQGINTDQVPVKAGDVRLLAIPDRKTATVGEQVTVSYYLVTSVPISGVSELQIPAIDGAATRTIELGKHLTPEEHGDEVRLLIARRALFPDSAGRLTIASASARVTAGSVVGGQEVAVRSPALTVAIVPLPAGPSAAVVGSWALSLSGPSEVTAGQPTTLHVIAKGTGDLDSLPTPELRAPASWKVFPPTTQEQPRVANGLVGGTRTWDFVVLPASDGEATIPAVQFATFDPVTRRYGSVSSSVLAVRVLAAAPVAAATVPSVASPLAALPASTRLPPWLGWALAVASLVTLVLLSLWRAPRRRGPLASSPGNRGDQAAAWGYLDRARRLCATAQAAPFFEALARALDQLVRDLGAAPKADTSEIAADLRQAGVSPPASETIQQAIETCRRFAFLRTEDVATMRRALVQADHAFGVLTER